MLALETTFLDFLSLEEQWFSRDKAELLRKEEESYYCCNGRG